MNYLRVSLLVGFALFALICVGYANSKHTPHKPSSVASSCDTLTSLTCPAPKSAATE